MRVLSKFVLFLMIIPVIITPNLNLNQNIGVMRDNQVGITLDPPIIINGNGGFAAYASQGNGSKSNPYIIDEYEAQRGH